MKRITIVGQGPGRTGEDRAPFDGKGSGSKLAELLGVSSLDSVAVLLNVLPKFYGKQGKGDRFPIREAKEAASRMAFDTEIVLLAGKNTARAFGVKSDYFEKTTICDRIAYVIPHPSGINRWWNDGGNRALAKAFFTEILH